MENRQDNAFGTDDKNAPVHHGRNREERRRYVRTSENVARAQRLAYYKKPPRMGNTVLVPTPSEPNPLYPLLEFTCERMRRESREKKKRRQREQRAEGAGK